MSAKNGPVEIIDSPNFLKIKASAPGGIDAAEAAAIGNAIVAGQRPAYLDWARADAAELHRLLPQAIAPGTEAFDLRHPSHRKLLDMAGQGGTFGYPLVSQIAGQLCDYLDRLSGAPPDEAILATHVDALQLVLKMELKDCGGAAGKELVGGLEKAVRKVLGDSVGR